MNHRLYACIQRCSDMAPLFRNLCQLRGFYVPFWNYFKFKFQTHSYSFKKPMETPSVILLHCCHETMFRLRLKISWNKARTFILYVPKKKFNIGMKLQGGCLYVCVFFRAHIVATPDNFLACSVVAYICLFVLRLYCFTIILVRLYPLITTTKPVFVWLL